MARIKNPTTGANMGRDRISSPSKDAIKKAGTVLVSVIHGEQIHLNLTASWMTTLTGATVTAKIVEGLNDGEGTIPTAVANTPQVTNLTIIDDDVSDNQFKILIPENLITNWDQAPLPDKPVYGFIGLEIQDANSGNNQQIWKPLRGLVEVLYSPTEAS